jgi:Ca2+-binding EF-hand superfamily protein
MIIKINRLKRRFIMSQSIFSGITSGLTNTYSILSQASSGQITLSSIAAAQSNSTYAASINPTFASYIQTNFANLDSNHDGVLGSSEINKLTTTINTTGLTSAQLSQLGSASGLSSNDLSQVLEHFSDIDANHDGKVTAAEISAYKLRSAEDKEKTEFRNKAATNMSVYYGSEDDTSSAPDSSSLLAFKYWNTGSGSNQ